jgi:hypothetical protein
MDACEARCEYLPLQIKQPMQTVELFLQHIRCYGC